MNQLNNEIHITIQVDHPLLQDQKFIVKLSDQVCILVSQIIKFNTLLRDYNFHIYDQNSQEIILDNQWSVYYQKQNKQEINIKILIDKPIIIIPQWNPNEISFSIQPQWTIQQLKNEIQQQQKYNRDFDMYTKIGQQFNENEDIILLDMHLPAQTFVFLQPLKKIQVQIDSNQSEPITYQMKINHTFNDLKNMICNENGFQGGEIRNKNNLVQDENIKISKVLYQPYDIFIFNPL